MKYKINQNEMDTSFRVPASLVDKHIRLATENQLKVLLWILRNTPENPDIEQMCADLKMNQDDAEDYLQYWVLTGVIEADSEKTTRRKKSTAAPEKHNEEPESKPAAVFERFVPTAPKPEPKTAAPILPENSKPAKEEVDIRAKEDPEVRLLFREAQTKLGKLIGYDLQCSLLMMHDYDGLPIEVIFMLLDYCVSINKTNNNYIAAVGKNWGAQEIDTIEKAAETIARLNSSNKIWSEFSAIAGLPNPRPTTSQTAYLSKWSTDFGFGTNMIYLAYEKMIDHGARMSFSYMDKVLTDWHESGFTTPEQVSTALAAASPSKAVKSDKKTQPRTSSPSYDIESFEQQAVGKKIVYERKKKST